MNQSGPDIPGIYCYTPDGCCGPSPCAIDEDEFICQIRSLLPEGDLYNNTLPPSPPASELTGLNGSYMICTFKIGCEQLILGGCCGEDLIIPCNYYVSAPQLAVVDSFSAVAWQAVVALCQMLRELDPCTADVTLRAWARRFGIEYPYCDGDWSDEVLAALICIMQQISQHVINLEFLQMLAARFGSTFVIYAAGDMNCGPLGWWTMARDTPVCPPKVICPPNSPPARFDAGMPMRLTPTCVPKPLSLNIVLCPGDIVFPDNCNDPHVPDRLPHDPELYAAFKWLLPKILPPSVYWCIYECDEADCIPGVPVSYPTQLPTRQVTNRHLETAL